MARKTKRPRATPRLEADHPLEGVTPAPAAAPKIDDRGHGKLFVTLTRVKHRAELRFVLMFSGIAGALFAVYSFPYPDGSAVRRWSDSYLQAYAHLSGWVLSAFERTIAVSGQDIIGHYSLRIVRGCDAIDAQILLASAVLASSTCSWRWRTLGAVSGVLFITLANVVRICTLYYVGEHFPAYFDFLHHELWPLLLIVLAVVAFIQWSKFATSRERPAHAPA